MQGLRAAAFVALVALSPAVLAAVDDPPAKKLFSAVTTPSPGAASPVGSYALGCLAGAVPLPTDGPNWQVVRLSRNRNWGTPQLVSFIQKLSTDAARSGWPGLLIGDMAQPRGGPMITGHDSHQTGLDVDIWYLAMPAHTMTAAERETIAAPSMLIDGKLQVDPKQWTPARQALLQQAASEPEVARIFVSPAIKQAVCDTATGDRTWIRKLRPWTDHEDHFHVRLTCPVGAASCVNQDPPPAGDGCGNELASWFKPAPPTPPPTPPFTVPTETALPDLPATCRAILTAQPGGLTTVQLKIIPPLPALRPSR